MSKDKWLELEYQALREELAKLMDIGHGTVRFCLPAAAAVYALPVVVGKTTQVYLWALCAALGGLLITAMVHTFCACIAGGRRIGAYIKEAIEPNTNGGLNWEAVIFEWEKRGKQASISPLLAVSAGSLLANVVAAAGAGRRLPSRPRFLGSASRRSCVCLPKPADCIPYIEGIDGSRAVCH